MRSTLLIHIIAGGLGLISGFVALYATKGATLHRKSGMVFVYTMLTMCTTGVVVAAGLGVAPAINIPAGLLTAYLVITSLITVRPPVPGGRWLDVGAMLVGLGVGLTSLTFGFQALASGGTRNGMPAFPFLMFGVVGALAGISDLRVIRGRRLQGAPRLARHLWRMCFALFISALSFFIGQADEFPEPLRIFPLLAAPVLTVLVTMLYWLWRVRRRSGHAPYTLASSPIPKEMKA